MQEAPSAAPSETASPAAPSATVIYVRPPPGIAQGKYEAPAYLVGIAAGLLIAGVAGFFFMRHRRARQRSASPHSLPPSGPVSSRR